jgi:hypothetical protein
MKLKKTLFEGQYFPKAGQVHRQAMILKVRFRLIHLFCFPRAIRLFPGLQQSTDTTKKGKLLKCLFSLNDCFYGMVKKNTLSEWSTDLFIIL